MSIWQGRSKRKVSGGRYRSFRDKRKKELGRQDILTKAGGEKRAKNLRSIGGKKRVKAVTLNEVNVVVGKKHKKAKIISIQENKANRHYTRMNVITKGAIVETDLGRVRITNRPSREGFANGLLLKE